MSATVDQRVVEMRFDNKQFESGAKESISTIQKLKNALNFSDSSNAFNGLQKAANNLDMSGLEKSVDGVKVKFSALQVAAATALSGIVNKAMGVGSQLIRSMGLDSIISGFNEYEQKMGSIQTILANTQSRQVDVSSEALDSVNATADQAVQRSNELNEQLTRNVQEAHNNQIEAFNEAAQAELEAYSKNSEALIDALDERAKAEQKQQQKSAKAQMEQFNETVQKELKAYDEKAEEQLKTLDKQLKEEQKKQSKVYQKELEEFNKKNNKRLEALQDELAEERDAKAESYEKEYEDLLKRQDDEMELLQDNHKAKLKLYREEYLQKLKATDEDRYKQIKAIDDQIDAINALTKAEAAERKAAAQRETLEALQRAVDISKNSSSRMRAEKELADYQAELAQERVIEERKQQIEQLEAQKDVINESFSEQKEKLQEEYELKQEQENDLYEQEAEALKERQKLERKSMQETYQMELAEIKKQQQAKLDALNEQIKVEREKFQEQQEEEQEAFSEKQTKRREALQDQISEEREAIQKRQEKERDALSEKISDEAEALSKRQQNERKALQEQISDGQKAIQKRQDSERKALQQRQSDELNAISERHEQEMSNIQTEAAARSAATKTTQMTKGSTLEDVNTALDELNKYSDKTIYNFAEMTRNIGTFTAAGVDLDTSVNAIKGIANLAALSGSSSQQASTAMYQLSQAIAAGKVNLEDWSSVVTAGISGQVFQDSLKETARVHGIAVDEMIAKNGSFRASIQEGWITSDILLETLSKFTGDLSEAELKSMGYTDEQIKHIIKMGKTATNAATEIKTFSQMLGSLSESAGSGWANTFEVIFGNFEEAKDLWTSMYNVLSGIIDAQANARNELLQSWKDLGGRQAIIEGFVNVWKALLSVVKPIKEAFRTIFPPTSAETLVKLSEGFRDLTEKMILSEDASNLLRDVFTLLFAVLKSILFRVGTLIKVIGSGLKIVGSFVDILVSLANVVVDLAANFVKAVVSTQDFQDFIGSIKDTYQGFADFFKGIVDGVVGNADKLTKRMNGLSFDLSGIGKAVVGAVSFIGKAIVDFSKGLIDALRAGDFERAVNIIEGTVSTILGLNLNRLVNTFNKIGDKGILDTLKALKTSIVDTFTAVQNQLKSKTLMTIAEAIGLLTASLVVLSLIPEEKLNASLGSVIVLFTGLYGTMKLFDQLMKSDTIGQVAKLGGSLISLGTSILILSAALKVLSTIDAEDMTKSLNAMGTMGLELTVCITVLQAAADKFQEGKIRGLIPFAIALGLLVGELKFVSEIDTDKLNRGLEGMQTMGILLASCITELQAASAIFKEGKIQGLITFALSMDLLLIALKTIANMETEKLKQGIIGLTALASLIAATLSVMTFINGEIDNASLIESAASVLVMAAAILVLAPALKLLATMDMDDIGRALTVLAGTFAIIGVAGLLLSPLAPIIMALGKSVLYMGAAALAAGVGVNLLAVGLPLLAVAGVAAAAGLIAALGELVVGILMIVRDSAGAFGEAVQALIKAICDVVIGCSYQLAEAFAIFIDDSLKALVKYVPSIIESLVDLIVLILDGLAKKMPELVNSVVNLFVKFFESITDAVANITTTSLEKALVGVGILATLMGAFAGLSVLAGAATAGVIAFGKFVAELTIVIAAIGAISKIPGVNWLIESGGEALYKIGEAIGKFVGGIAGGAIEAYSSNLPQIGTNLSDFMKNLQPFLEGSGKMTPEVSAGAQNLSDMILILTKSAVINGLGSWFTGKNNLVQFGEELAAFGPKFQEYYGYVHAIKPDVLEATSAAAKSLAEFANLVPNQGGLVMVFTGDNKISKFAKELVTFGAYFAAYADEIKNIKPDVVTTSTNCARAIVEMARIIPNTGGLVTLFTGNNDISKFGEKLNSFGYAMLGYYNSVKQIQTVTLSNMITEVKKLVNLAKDIEGIDTSKMAKFGSDLKKMGDKGIKEFLDAFKNSRKKVQSTVQSFVTYFFGQMDNKMPSSNFTSRGKKLAEALANGLDSLVSRRNVRNATKNLTSEIKNTVENNLSYNEFYRIGQDVAYGLSNGIQSEINSIANAAINAANAAIDNARYTFGVYSPSRVFHQIGEYVSIGLSNGIKDKIPAIAAASTEMTGEVIDPVKLALERISDVIDDELDTNPEIIPTLDLSQVIDGASQVSSIFGGLRLGQTASLAQGAYASFGQAAKIEEIGVNNQQLNDKLDQLIDVTKENSGQTEQYNNFYINSTDPVQAAEEVGYILQRQVERGRAAWGR